MAVHPLRPATDRRFGRPLPCQLANQTRVHPVPGSLPFRICPCGLMRLCGISICFQMVSPCTGQVAHALLTRPPLENMIPKTQALSSSCSPVRLACVRHAASVHPEPGSNSQFKLQVRSVLSFPSKSFPLRTPFRKLSAPVWLFFSASFLMFP